MLYEMYDGDDHDKQIECLKGIAAGIAFGLDDPSTSAEERVDYYCEEWGDELPGWFDEHDKRLLIQFVKGSQQEEV